MVLSRAYFFLHFTVLLILLNIDLLLIQFLFFVCFIYFYCPFLLILWLILCVIVVTHASKFGIINIFPTILVSRACNLKFLTVKLISKSFIYFNFAQVDFRRCKLRIILSSWESTILSDCFVIDSFICRLRSRLVLFDYFFSFSYLFLLIFSTHVLIVDKYYYLSIYNYISIIIQYPMCQCLLCDCCWWNCCGVCAGVHHAYFCASFWCCKP